VELNLWQVLILALVQGIAEFLPISSSGHLVLLAMLMDVDPEKFDLVELNIVLHAGTLASILVVYRNHLRDMIRQDLVLPGRIVIATVPAVVFALAIKLSDADRLLESPLVAAIGLFVTGTILLISQRIQDGTKSIHQLHWSTAIWIGCSQALAILPGISRSGSTICSGQACGLSQKSAATFSFLMAIPAIGGAITLEILKSFGEKDSSTIPTPMWLLLVGAIVSFFVGWAALVMLLKVVERGRLHWFAWWCFAAGLFALIWQATIKG